MSRSDAFELARRQLALDLAATARFPGVYPKKRAKLLASPHAFLRGSAPLFYELLAAHPELADGPAGEGWIVGDMHLENMGAFKADDAKVVFDLNDFDDAAIAPWRYDVLRLATSTLLAARALGADGRRAIELAARLVRSWAEDVFDGRAPEPPLPDPLAELVHAAERRSKKDLLDARAPTDHGQRHFVRGERYLDLDPQALTLAHALLPAYVAALGPRAPQRAPSWRVLDVAHRIAGTGSLGRLRFAVLVVDDAGDERILDFKEASPSSVRSAPGCDPAANDDLGAAARVIAAARALVEHPPRLLAAVGSPSTSSSFVVRQLTPQEDKLDVAKVAPRVLESVAARAAFVLARAHRRAVTRPPPAAWSEVELAGLVDRAIELAGLHEAIYLAHARLSS